MASTKGNKKPLNIAVVGGGINGLCSAWMLALAGHRVTLYESDKLMGKTSTASSKLLHGGLRYLENFEFRLVREALQERQWWLEHVPALTRRLPILYPIYQHTRSRWKIKLGLMLYDLFAGKKGIGRHRWLSSKQIKRISPNLIQDNLKGGYLFFDGQMDDAALGLWVAQQCRELGVEILENCRVQKLDTQGYLETVQNGKISQHQYQRIINVAGPWSAKLLSESAVSSTYHLDLVRGSHLILPSISKFGHMLEVPNEKRIVFVVPFKQNMLIGTTEVRQTIDEPINCSAEEREYLLGLYNYYFEPDCQPESIIKEFSGLRPLLTGSDNPSKASREYQIIKQDHLISVFGGKWTTARALGKTVLKRL